jgi:hypothetical protein
MVTNTVQHQAAVRQALDGLNLDYQSGDTDLQVESTIDDGQWVQLTSMRDGLKRPPIPQIHAARVLAKTLPDGSPAFWMPGMPYTPPEPQIGSIKCYFHPDFDEEDGASGISREFIVQAGMGDFTCNSGDLSKQNRGDFKTVLMRDAHMHSRHRRQLEAIQRAQGDEKEQAERTERQLDREYLRQQTEAMLRLAGRALPEVEPITEAAPAVAVELPAVSRSLKVCDICGREFKNVGSHKRFARDQAHAEAREGA